MNRIDNPGSKVNKGSYVQIQKTVLEPNERPDNIPEDTRRLPLQMKVKGFLQEDSTLGDSVKIKTVIGREVEGELIDVNPYYDHDFGRVPRELLDIGPELKNLLREADR
ncbi:2-amino-4-oxopentanoate thiolase subunit OrtA [Natranaerofaba carboxydovora]|uniref:2-amino-4-oxopentanoate thiolase subunit OrtA n=1 Tax=Natranaerofaba carboxydovora TaxID=2742683 RepID=UPI001F135C27|nr:2-amino-4-oxopentanoate thiolase subunit OrtA [Natranaerofaba carboxydovora]UMZ74826.1 2-amino-4-ketopentanoate thiolase alpha subunit [Natranaerofaba carboxydovora]